MKKLLSANLPEKLAACTISLLLWQVVLRIEQPITSRSFENIPISYTLPPNNLVATDKPTRIHVDANALLAGGESIVRDDIVATVDLSKAKPGRGSYPVQMSYIGSTSTPLELVPRMKTVEVFIENWVERDLQVNAATTGAWDLYRPGPITVTPSNVRISGPESKVSLANEARVEINLASVEPGAATQSPVQILTETGKPLELTMDPSSVTVRVKPVALPPSKNVIVQPNWTGTPGFGFRITNIEIVPNQIRIMGAAESLESLSSISTIAIDISGIAENRTLRVGLVLPQGIRSENNSVEVRIRVEPHSGE
ncbi:MAG: CdaR family protein [Armatimonadota bacterium]|nr:CdaR family protein [Armatimonadota bacterium]